MIASSLACLALRETQGKAKRMASTTIFLRKMILNNRSSKEIFLNTMRYTETSMALTRIRFNRFKKEEKFAS